MVTPQALRDDGWSEDRIEQLLIDQFDLDRTRAREWIRALDAGEQPYDDVIEQTERGSG